MWEIFGPNIRSACSIVQLPYKSKRIRPKKVLELGRLNGLRSNEHPARGCREYLLRLNCIEVRANLCARTD